MTWRAPVVVTPPEGYPLSAVVADKDLRLDGGGSVSTGAQFDRLATCIAAATDRVQAMTATRLLEQDLTIACDAFADFERLGMEKTWHGDPGVSW